MIKFKAIDFSQNADGMIDIKITYIDRIDDKPDMEHEENFSVHKSELFDTEGNVKPQETATKIKEKTPTQEFFDEKRADYEDNQDTKAKIELLKTQFLNKEFNA